MAERSALDPFGWWAELASRVEKAGNAAGAERLRSPEFSQAMNKALAAGLGARKLSRDAVQRAFEVLNLVSRSDVALLAERLQAIEERLMAVQDGLSRLGAGGALSAPATQLPPRTRRPAAEGQAPPAAPPVAAALPVPVPAPVPAPAKPRRKPVAPARRVKARP